MMPLRWIFFSKDQNIVINTLSRLALELKIIVHELCVQLWMCYPFNPHNSCLCRACITVFISKSCNQEGVALRQTLALTQQPLGLSSVSVYTTGSSHSFSHSFLQ